MIKKCNIFANTYRFFMLFFLACINVTCSEDTNEIMQGDGIIYGKILDSKNSQPLQGVSVTIYPGGNTYVTGSDGLYEFNNLRRDSYILQISKDKYYSQIGNVSLQTNSNFSQLDFSLKEGNPCLEVIFGTMNFDENSMSKSFIVRNVGNETIEWNIHSDYQNVLYFNKTNGTLKPQESEAININISLHSISSNIKSLPIFISTTNERTGVIATIDDKRLLQNSLLIGTWCLEEIQIALEDDEDITFNRFNDYNSTYFRLYSNYKYEDYTRKILQNNGDTDAMFYYELITGEFFYDQAHNVLQLGEYGTVYHIKNLTKNYLELEKYTYNEDEIPSIYIFKRK